MTGPETAEGEILRDYYLEKDFISSTDGILKVLSVIACIVSGVLALVAGGGGCARAPALASSAGALALVAAAVVAALTALALLSAPAAAPNVWLYTDLVSSTLVGVLLMVAAVLGAALCPVDSLLDYVYFIVVLVTVCLTTGSAALGYAAAMRRVDAVRPPREQRGRSPTEQDA